MVASVSARAGLVDNWLRRLALRPGHNFRARVRELPGGTRTWQVCVIVVGLVLVVAGLAMLVLPGPGWLVIFLGMSVFSTEFVWAEWSKRKLAGFTDWAVSTSTVDRQTCV